jgi:hypothetical protein
MIKKTRRKKSCGPLPVRHEILIINSTVPEAWQAQYPVPPSSDPAPLYTHQTGLHRSNTLVRHSCIALRIRIRIHGAKTKGYP